MLRVTTRRALAVLAGLLVVAAIWFAVDGGQFLVREDPLQHADAIFVLDGTHLERPLEAVDLYKAGWAPLIVLSPGRPEPAELLARRNGIVFPRMAELVKSAMVQLGVPSQAIVADFGSVDNTAGEANLLRAMVMAHHWTRVIVVTSKYHTRRAGFAFRRGLKGTGATPIVRASRYDPFDPAHWWRTRADIRYGGREWVSLILYYLGLNA